MFAISLAIPPRASIADEPPKKDGVSSGNSMSGNRIPTFQEDEVRRALLPDPLNARANVCAPHDLRKYPDSEYAYATPPTPTTHPVRPPIELALFPDRKIGTLLSRCQRLRFSPS